MKEDSPFPENEEKSKEENSDSEEEKIQLSEVEKKSQIYPLRIMTKKKQRNNYPYTKMN